VRPIGEDIFLECKACLEFWLVRAIISGMHSPRASPYTYSPMAHENHQFF